MKIYNNSKGIFLKLRKLPDWVGMEKLLLAKPQFPGMSFRRNLFHLMDNLPKVLNPSNRVFRWF
ncbi:hypothetical protein IIC38_18355 [candidate division KSB1 bacterium]|nr:hypothetical protein [candidate division KSB1 bacterium]